MQSPITDFWGKAQADKSGGVVAWHPLADHCLDVAVVFRQLVVLPGLRRALESAAGCRLGDAQLDRLAVFALLHDLGKFNLGFQRKLEPGAARHGHVVEAAGLFGRGEAGFEALRIDKLGSWFAGGIETAQAVLLAAISHHGQPLSNARIEREDACRVFAKLWAEEAPPRTRGSPLITCDIFRNGLGLARSRIDAPAAPRRARMMASHEDQL